METTTDLWREDDAGDAKLGSQNEIGFYNADEEEVYNERGGTQGEPPGDEVAREILE